MDVPVHGCPFLLFLREQKSPRCYTGPSWAAEGAVTPRIHSVLGSQIPSLSGVTSTWIPGGCDSTALPSGNWFWLPTVAWSCPFSGISIKQLIEKAGQLFSFLILLTSHGLYIFVIFFPTKNTCWNWTFKSRQWMCVLFPSNGNMQTVRMFAWFTFWVKFKAQLKA